MRPTGLCGIYTLQNTASPGLMPTEKLVIVTTAYYAERTVGYGRFYAAAGANRQVDKLIRAFNTSIDESDMYVILEDGKQYQVDLMQKVGDHMDLTLKRVEDYYEVAEPTT